MISRPPAGVPVKSCGRPGFTLPVVHHFPSALQTTSKYLALSRDGNLYEATSAVGTSNGTVFKRSGGATYTRLATLDYAHDGGPFRAPVRTAGWLAIARPLSRPSGRRSFRRRRAAAWIALPR